MTMLPKGSLPDYQFDENEDFIVTEGMKEAFNQDGCIIVRNILSKDEIGKLLQTIESPDSELLTKAYDKDDGEGRKVRMILWNHPGSDITGMINRSEKVVNTCKELIGGEVYHYHTKIVMKNAFTGGIFPWHQDYGYWYFNGLLFPDLITCQIALDKMDAENGALQVLRGSHKMGRIEHGKLGQGLGADLERVGEAEKLIEKHLVVLEPGDALFFHSNVLHRSDANNSNRRRWAMTACYNRIDNNPVKDHHHARYTPLNVVPNSAIMECKSVNDISGKWFFNLNTTDKGYIPKDLEKLK